MLTFVESISLAGDRAKQNDDTLGFTNAAAWVIDGATDLDTARLTGAASDASWLAQMANASLYRHAGECDLRTLIARASAEALAAMPPQSGDIERWRWPIASLLICAERDDLIEGAHLGDCRVFALGADGAFYQSGADPDHADEESANAAKQSDSDKPLLERTETIARLRRGRALLNTPGNAWTFCTHAPCADHAAMWSFKMQRPGHVLLMTDGFSALADRYNAYDGPGLVRAAIDKGLEELGRELRAIENADAGSSLHPRYKKSDDATAILMRLS